MQGWKRSAPRMPPNIPREGVAATGVEVPTVQWVAKIFKHLAPFAIGVTHVPRFTCLSPPPQSSADPSATVSPL